MLTPEQALQNLCIAARQAKLTADEHFAIQQSGNILKEFIASTKATYANGRSAEDMEPERNEPEVKTNA